MRFARLIPASYRPLRTLLLAGAAFTVVNACSDSPTEVERSQLDRAEALWESTNGNSNYRMDQQLSCFCGPPLGARLSVVNKAITAAVTLDSLRPLTSGEVAQFKTVPQIFAYLRQTLALKGASVNVTYDPTNGYPVEMYVDPYPQGADDELGLKITGLVKLMN